jgi:murein DD-endopeptidase MepM/ murein hydrolase activator NlpD
MKPNDSGLTALALILLLAVGCILLAVGYASLSSGPPPVIVFENPAKAIGRKSAFSVRASEPNRGLSRVRIELSQGTNSQALVEKLYDPRGPLDLWGARTTEDTVRAEISRDSIPWLKEGTATLRVIADRAPSWLLAPEPVLQEMTLPVRLRPPLLQVLSSQTYVSQGGCEAVVYRVGETSVRDGVRAGERWFPGYPLPGGGKDVRFSFFAVPYDMADASNVRLIASDDVGNESEARFIEKFFPTPLRKDTIELTDVFLKKVVPPILAQSPEITARGDLLSDYLLINGELRKLNSRTLTDLAAKSKAEFQWTQAFIPLRNAKVMSAFADRRTYLYQGRAVDHQDHLGFDLAATRATPIPAANHGTVVLARFFGIFGNSVVLDHGYGLMSLYGHLSTIDVREGESVQRGAILGKSGATGLAGGDHLHFSILLQGLPVNPKEWWDGHWIQDRIARKLGSAFRFSEQ